ncbi:MAG: ATP--guanido phosphotransferase [Oscillospiraceae bacterium]|jgi:protein arginine kinase|nr:ATP--guanido phosphotransferase [Oscillospiraceae bacterium]
MNQSPWYAKAGDVVFSSRVRLARNVAGYAFPARLPQAEKAKLQARVTQAAKDAMPDLVVTDMQTISAAEAFAMAARWEISRGFAAQQTGVLLSDQNKTVGIMVCEEDHIRLQTLEAGLDLPKVFDRANKIDDAIAARLPYAFDAQLGYLTQCPTNLGTAMRASVLLHLPALASLDRVALLGETFATLGYTIRGAFGEGTEAQGALFQLSNQVTLGMDEQTVIADLQAHTLQIIEKERRAAAQCLRQPKIKDQIWRAFGILSAARLLEHNEAVQLLSLVRMGAARGILPVPLERVNALIPGIQPASIALLPDGTDAEKRANLVRGALGT